MDRFYDPRAPAVPRLAPGGVSRRAEEGAWSTSSRSRARRSPAALEKAERYRLLNEPVEAESICLDVLRLEPDNQQALTTLLLALTDQFDEDAADAVSQARELVPRFKDEYARAYYAGIIASGAPRRAWRRAGRPPGTSPTTSCARRWCCSSRRSACGPPGNDDALLRWNTCVRILERHPHVTQAPRDHGEPPLE